MMIMNSLCALAFGFALDMMLGDPGGSMYPVNLVKRLVSKLETMLKNAYLESPEARNMAGIMLVVMTLLICLGISVALLLLCYKLNVIVGILMEGLLCWFSMSGREMRRNLLGVFRAVRTDNVSAARRYLRHITDRDVDEMTSAECAKCAVEAASEDIVDQVVAPIFWACLFGGIGAVFCRVVNIMDNIVGFKDDDHIHFGRVAAKLDDVVMFIPARLAAAFMRWDAAFLRLDKQNAAEIYRRDKRHSPSPNSGCTMSVAAGALDVRLGGDEVRNGFLTKRRYIGDDIHPISADEVFWINQLVTGTAAGALIFAAVMRTAAYLLTLQLMK
ncbi:adenosylcobinamide-phosphate synthase CbiB [Ruminococcus sp.]|uniref:adenosylcobinamide-phosphate synthase CbiB n=1 Tax=Ruminococcus sp. TaxID=41978 RepID=UPI0025D0CD2C|nr:adenosylcobinamide-phosphate synthase CbiB [Ruminococcus sp.]MBQ8967195.1 cobalamin biosynthesis protein CobD [Ruminococcus sp.]